MRSHLSQRADARSLRCIAWRPVQDPVTHAIVYLSLEADTGALLDTLGERALASSGKVANEACGRLRVRVTKKKP